MFPSSGQRYSSRKREPDRGLPRIAKKYFKCDIQSLRTELGSAVSREGEARLRNAETESKLQAALK
jgi:hypothetical protein